MSTLKANAINNISFLSILKNSKETEGERYNAVKHLISDNPAYEYIYYKGFDKDSNDSNLLEYNPLPNELWSRSAVEMIMKAE